MLQPFQGTRSARLPLSSHKTTRTTSLQDQLSRIFARIVNPKCANFQKGEVAFINLRHPNHLLAFTTKIVANDMPVGADESGSPELGTNSDTAASSLLLEADREDQIPVTPPVTPQVIDDVTSSPTRNTRLQGAKRSYVEVARSSLD
eukprot:scaffold1786_cov138-Cylindrotheca_fusiformis.AAC.11